MMESMTKSNNIVKKTDVFNLNVNEININPPAELGRME